MTQDFDEEEVEGLKVKILAAVASLDRGLAANVRHRSAAAAVAATSAVADSHYREDCAPATAAVSA